MKPKTCWKNPTPCVVPPDQRGWGKDGKRVPTQWTIIWQSLMNPMDNHCHSNEWPYGFQTTMCALSSKERIRFNVSTCRTYRETCLMIDAELCRHIMNQTVQVRTRSAWNSLCLSPFYLSFVPRSCPHIVWLLSCNVRPVRPAPICPTFVLHLFCFKKNLAMLSLHVSFTGTVILCNSGSFCFSIRLLHSPCSFSP